jgi:hypothetical protein
MVKPRPTAKPRKEIVMEMENKEKAREIRQWINPDERITVNFTDEWNLNAVVLGCTDEVVHLSLETSVPHVTQPVSIPLREVIVAEDPSRYTRDPERPLRYGRLTLTIDRDRPDGQL